MSEVKSFENKWGDRIELHEKHIKIIIASWGGWFPPSDKPIGPKTTQAGEYKIPYTGTNVEYNKGGIWRPSQLTITKDLEVTHIWHEVSAVGWEEIPLLLYKKGASCLDLEKAKKHEKLLEFDEAADIYKELGMDEEVIRVRKLKAEQGAVKVSQKVVHGDEVTKTEIKDSVLNRSNVGGGSSKAEELREAKSLLDEGLINEDDYEKMKKEILNG